MEWLLLPDGRWREVDTAAEARALAVQMRELCSANRERIAQSRALCDRLKQHLRALEAWRRLRPHPTVQ